MSWEPCHYLIRVRGQLDPDWSTWFDGLAITHTPAGDTVMTGALADQAALYGLLRQASRLGLTLVAVTRLEEEGAPR